MAINGAEVEVIGPGIVEDLAQNKSYVQNMYFHNLFVAMLRVKDLLNI
jgi:hypothetical protein